MYIHSLHNIKEYLTMLTLVAFCSILRFRPCRFEELNLAAFLALLLHFCLVAERSDVLRSKAGPAVPRAWRQREGVAVADVLAVVF